MFFVHPHVSDVDKACADELQAVARVRRFGQEKPQVTKWRFVASDSVEEDLVEEHRRALEKQAERKRKFQQDREAKKAAKTVVQGGVGAEGVSSVAPKSGGGGAASSSAAAVTTSMGEWVDMEVDHDEEVGQMAQFVNDNAPDIGGQNYKSKMDFWAGSTSVGGSSSGAGGWGQRDVGGSSSAAGGWGQQNAGGSSSAAGGWGAPESGQ